MANDDGQVFVGGGVEKREDSEARQGWHDDIKAWCLNGM